MPLVKARDRFYRPFVTIIDYWKVVYQEVGKWFDQILQMLRDNANMHSESKIVEFKTEV